MFKYVVTKYLWSTVGVLRGIAVAIAGFFAVIGGAFVFSEDFRKIMIGVSKTLDETAEEKTATKE